MKRVAKLVKQSQYQEALVRLTRIALTPDREGLLTLSH